MMEIGLIFIVGLILVFAVLFRRGRSAKKIVGEMEQAIDVMAVVRTKIEAAGGVFEFIDKYFDEVKGYEKEFGERGYCIDDEMGIKVEEVRMAALILLHNLREYDELQNRMKAKTENIRVIQTKGGYEQAKTAFIMSFTHLGVEDIAGVNDELGQFARGGLQEMSTNYNGYDADEKMVGNSLRELALQRMKEGLVAWEEWLEADSETLALVAGSASIFAPTGMSVR